MTPQTDEERAIDAMDTTIRRQRAVCFSKHRYRADTLRLHPTDYDLLRSFDALWFLYSNAPDRPERYMGMEVVIDPECLDGPVVECKAWWEHGRTAPRGYVA